MYNLAMSKKHDHKEFGARLQQLRKEQGLTQIDLSQRGELSKSYVSFLESGVRHPSREVVLRLAEVLGSGQNGHLRDELLVLAGFSPENPHYLRQNLTKSKQSLSPSAKPSFRAFLHNTLGLIRQGQFNTAQNEIEKGFSRFNKPAQLQTLLAHLELARGRFEQAIVLQKAAIAQQELSPPNSEEKGLSPVDFILNLGVMYFMQGDQALFQLQDTEMAQNAYHQALQAFEEGLKLQSGHLYLLDEAGRVHFNLADLHRPPQNQEHWQASVRYFRAVLDHPQRQELNPETQVESAAFLALAYAKSGDFHSADLLLQALSIQAEPFWLLWYIQACYYSLYAQSQPDDKDLMLERALDSLRKACEYNPEARQQALLDQQRDLSALAQGRPEAFQEVCI